MKEFRYDIQGLRGLCMLVIFLYHYNKNILPCGIFGVDIFFLISGYVNALSNFHKIEFGYLDFLARRIKRLVPTAYLGLIYSLSVIKSYVLQYQNKLIDDISSCAISLSNYRFYSMSVNYVMQSESKSIVLHYWSLSIEDQIYLFFPFLCYLENKNYFTVILIIVSYIYSLYLYNFNYSLLYFSTLSRLWEFATGWLLIGIRKHIYFDDIIILYSTIALFFNARLAGYVPLVSIIPLLFISIILLKEIDNSSILASQILVFFGNISYPFYILHYIMIFNNIKNNINDLFIKFFYILVISYIINKFFIFYINNLHLYIYIILVVYIISMIIILLYNENLIKINLVKQQNHGVVKYTYVEIIREWKNFFKTVCKCKDFFTLKTPKNLILLLMDSHGEQWSNIFIPYANQLHYILIQIYFKDSVICKKKFIMLHKFLTHYKPFRYTIIAHSIECINNYPSIFLQNRCSLQNR